MRWTCQLQKLETNIDEFKPIFSGTLFRLCGCFNVCCVLSREAFMARKCWIIRLPNEQLEEEKKILQMMFIMTRFFQQTKQETFDFSWYQNRLWTLEILFCSFCYWRFSPLIGYYVVKIGLLFTTKFFRTVCFRRSFKISSYFKVSWFIQSSERCNSSRSRKATRDRWKPMNRHADVS